MPTISRCSPVRAQVMYFADSLWSGSYLSANNFKDSRHSLLLVIALKVCDTKPINPLLIYHPLYFGFSLPFPTWRPTSLIVMEKAGDSELSEGPTSLLPPLLPGPPMPCYLGGRRAGQFFQSDRAEGCAIQLEEYFA